MTLACKHAILQQGRRAPDLPRRGADAARRRQRRLGPRGPAHPARDQPAGVGARAGARPDRDGQAPGDHRRPRRPLPPRSGDRARRADRRAGDHDVQGQGADRRRPSARVRRARPQRHPGRELVHERGRPADRARRVVLQPHRHLSPATRSSRSTSTRCSSASSTPSRCPSGARSASSSTASASDLARRRPTASTSAPSSPSAGRSGAPRRPAASATTAATGVNSAIVFAALGRQIPDDAVIAVDVGNHAYSFGRYFECKPGQSVLMSGYLGSIGFGYPAAMGAWAAAPDRPIFAVTGDGGFAQYMAELPTAVKHKMKITHVLLNNGQLGKISQGAARRRMGGLADLAAQPGLLRLRPQLRRARHPRHRRLAARRRPRRRRRARRPGDGRSDHRPQPRLELADPDLSTRR